MTPTYSKTRFDTYTHRFIVHLSIDSDYRNDTRMDIYTDCASEEELRKMIETKKSDKVQSYSVEHCATRQQDDANNEFITEFLNSL